MASNYFPVGLLDQPWGEDDSLGTLSSLERRQRKAAEKSDINAFYKFLGIVFVTLTLLLLGSELYTVATEPSRGLTGAFFLEIGRMSGVAYGQLQNLYKAVGDVAWTGIAVVYGHDFAQRGVSITDGAAQLLANGLYYLALALSVLIMYYAHPAVVCAPLRTAALSTLTAGGLFGAPTLYAWLVSRLCKTRSPEPVVLWALLFAGMMCFASLSVVRTVGIRPGDAPHHAPGVASLSRHRSSAALRCQRPMTASAASAMGSGGAAGNAASTGSSGHRRSAQSRTTSVGRNGGGSGSGSIAAAAAMARGDAMQPPSMARSGSSASLTVSGGLLAAFSCLSGASTPGSTADPVGMQASVRAVHRTTGSSGVSGSRSTADLTPAPHASGGVPPNPTSSMVTKRGAAAAAAAAAQRGTTGGGAAATGPFSSSSSSSFAPSASAAAAVDGRDRPTGHAYGLPACFDPVGVSSSKLAGSSAPPRSSGTRRAMSAVLGGTAAAVAGFGSGSSSNSSCSASAAAKLNTSNSSSSSKYVIVQPPPPPPPRKSHVQIADSSVAAPAAAATATPASGAQPAGGGGAAAAATAAVTSSQSSVSRNPWLNPNPAIKLAVGLPKGLKSAPAAGRQSQSMPMSVHHPAAAAAAAAAEAPAGAARSSGGGGAAAMHSLVASSARSISYGGSAAATASATAGVTSAYPSIVDSDSHAYARPPIFGNTAAATATTAAPHLSSEPVATAAVAAVAAAPVLGVPASVFLQPHTQEQLRNHFQSNSATTGPDSFISTTFISSDASVGPLVAHKHASGDLDIANVAANYHPYPSAVTTPRNEFSTVPILRAAESESTDSFSLFSTPPPPLITSEAAAAAAASIDPAVGLMPADAEPAPRGVSTGAAGHVLYGSYGMYGGHYTALPSLGGDPVWSHNVPSVFGVPPGLKGARAAATAAMAPPPGFPSHAYGGVFAAGPVSGGGDGWEQSAAAAAAVVATTASSTLSAALPLPPAGKNDVLASLGFVDDGADAAADGASGGGGGSSEDAGASCAICWSEPRQVGFLHGKTSHLCVCRRCAAKLREGVHRCPMCRQLIERIIDIY
ncbi:hypothetical protein VOLCADRAFT_118163 [Volvox carteri f. nagariensis]|uniref:RING-type domain-containing protein n=1 Tax=Volvox carteri f. nagariensis TaxID=3068 RepID=D8U2F2_VOLCA|nr:uncharacterized protein VOLCADRAFT_118163 [Volvox carteri f. nagariensis]EFJ46124.1 hypothetical protein VOLCADRAFT_118163 [Volvox carteri f. nagariensis]|eukprot:XP_002952874.1 hypothetical protein VOLCADRAFT_118163 [Volvox carteri f. nagariensis]